jgi:hypothetical protein
LQLRADEATSSWITLHKFAAISVPSRARDRLVMSRMLTLTLYGHTKNHSSFVAGCLLWIRTKGTLQYGHSLPSLLRLAMELESVEATFIGLPYACPAMAPPQSREEIWGHGILEGARGDLGVRDPGKNWGAGASGVGRGSERRDADG